MATLVLQTVGSVVGGMIGGPVGAMAGRALGALAGAAIDNALSRRRRHEASSRGRASRTSTASPPRRARRSRGSTGARASAASSSGRRACEEAVNTDVERSGSQGGKGIGRRAEDASPPPIPISPISRSACARAAIAFVRRVWADGRELDLSTIAMRVHRGQRDAERRSADRREGGRAISRRPIAASPMWCSSACRSPTSATACRNSPSR